VCQQGTTWVCPGGKWTSADASCKFDYSAAPLWLAFESCVPGFGAESVVENVSVRYYADTCDCTPGASCGTGLACKETQYFDLRAAPAGSSGFRESIQTTNVCRSDM
jgi:hypothetical protein